MPSNMFSFSKLISMQFNELNKQNTNLWFHNGSSSHPMLGIAKFYWAKTLGATTAKSIDYCLSYLIDLYLQWQI